MEYPMNHQVQSILENAHKEAKEMGNNYIGSEHLLLSIIKDKNTVLSHILREQGIYYYQIKEDLMILFGIKEQAIQETKVTQVVEEILEEAKNLAIRDKKQVVDADTLSIALLKTNDCVGNEILHRYDVNIEEVLLEILHVGNYELDQMKELRNLNTCEMNKTITGRDKELKLIVSILLRKDKANPLLIGEPGVGKTALVEKLASMIEHHEIPELSQYKIYELHLNSLVAGTKYRGDFEEKMQRIINLLETYKNIILYIDEIHQMIGAGKSEGSIDVASVLKPYLARGKIKCIGSTTIEEYEKFMEKDRALERRFQIVRIQEPNKEETLKMLQVKVKEYENYHHVQIQNNILQFIVKYCDYYIPQRRFPDKAMDVLDLSCVRTMQMHKKKVEEDIVKEVMEEITNIPFVSCARNYILENELRKKLVGHSLIVEKVLRQLRWMEQGIIMQRPLGVWLFVGNEEVGKEIVLKELSQYYFRQKEMPVFNFATLRSNFVHHISLLKRNPYCIVQIKNLHLANKEQLQIVQQAIKQGYFEYQGDSIDLRHSLLVMDGEFLYKDFQSMHFQEKMDVNKLLSKQLTSAFVNQIDEIFVFEELNEEDKLHVMKTILKQWNTSISDEELRKVVVQCKTLDEIKRELKHQIA